MPLFPDQIASSISEFTDVVRQVFTPALAPVPAPGGGAAGGAAAGGSAAPPAAAAPAPAAPAPGGVPAPVAGAATPAADVVFRWFRGQARADWDIVPSLARAPYRIDGEKALIKRFRQNAYSLLPNPPKTDWEWMFLMQHHGAPTRLVDWTENALCALYFSVDSEPLHDAAVWCVDPVALNKAAYMQPTGGREFLFFGIDSELDQYDTESLSKPNKPPVAALAPRYFPRIAAQSGVFTIHHRDPAPLNQVHGGAHVGKIVVPAGAKKQLLEDLAILGIRRLTLFPELDAVAKFAKEVFQ
jgi:hypothetical protein